MTSLETRPVAHVPAATHGIAEVAELTGVSAHALRYYERIGLLSVSRDHAGHRTYTSNDVQRVIFITRLRHTDMPIRDISRYFSLVEAGPGNESQRLELLIQHRESVLKRLRTLETALEAIDFKITLYGGQCKTPS